MRLTQQHLAVAIAALYLSVGALLQAWVQATATKPEQRATRHFVALAARAAPSDRARAELAHAQQVLSPR